MLCRNLITGIFHIFVIKLDFQRELGPGRKVEKEEHQLKEKENRTGHFI